MTTFVRNSAILACMALGLFTQSAFAQKAEPLKIVMVDVNSVVSAMPDYLTATQKVQSLQKSYQDSLQIMKTRYQTTAETYAKLGETATADAKKKEAEDLASLADVANKFNEDKFGQNGELAQMQTNLLKPILEKVQNALDAFRKKNRISFILPKGSVVSTDPELDMTTQFGDFLKGQ